MVEALVHELREDTVCSSSFIFSGLQFQINCSSQKCIGYEMDVFRKGCHESLP